MKTLKKTSKVQNGEVQLAVAETGEGQTLVFFNGGGATQISWKQIIEELKGQYRLVTFDFRNHGKTNAARDTSLEGFQTDAETIMENVAGDHPILIGWSLGADLAVWYAASHPGKAAGLFLIDGAVPVNLVQDPVELWRRLDTPVMRIGPRLLSLVGKGYRLSPSEYATLTIEVNKRREQLLTAYQQLDCPVEMVLAAKSAGEKGEHAERNNGLWRAGAEKLVQSFPEISLSWIDNTHLLPFTEPVRIAQLLEAFVERCLTVDRTKILGQLDREGYSGSEKTGE
jgi:pimeloyl-ACP methyl ester carboxylesterase